MNKELLHKYFHDECSEEELKQVLGWFQTSEGQQFLVEDIDDEFWQLENTDTASYKSDIESRKIFNRILIHRNRKWKQKTWIGLRVASILLIFGLLSSVLYFGNYTSFEKDDPPSAPLIFSTNTDQQKILTLDDGTKIRLNENSSLVIHNTLEKREVELRGEAYFEVISIPDRPFIVNTIGSRVKVLGTKFNVKSDTLQNNVEVAVIEGKVTLASASSENAAKAVLTRNNFGILQLSNSQIIIEKANTNNYLSWINNRLKFNGEKLTSVSQQLERIYDVEISFQTGSLKKLNLTADIEKGDLPKVLTTIANTFDINYKMNGSKIIWTY